jgi:hypothetical protein
LSETSDEFKKSFDARSANIGAVEQKELQSPIKAIQPKEVPPAPKRSKSARGNFVVFMNFMMSCLVIGVLGICLLALYM